MLGLRAMQVPQVEDERKVRKHQEHRATARVLSVCDDDADKGLDEFKVPLDAKRAEAGVAVSQLVSEVEQVANAIGQLEP